MLSSEKVLYLSIASFFIKLVFPFSVSNQKEVWGDKLLEEINHYYAGFLVQQPAIKPHFSVILRDEKPKYFVLGKRREKYYHISRLQNKQSILTNTRISLAQFELVLRYVIQMLIENHGFVLHSSAVLVNSKAYLFLGNSGIGKSTVRQLLSSRFSELSDDTSIIMKEKNKYWFYQSPDVEKSPISKSSQRYEIGGLFFLRRAANCQITLLTQNKAIQKQLVAQVRNLLRGVALKSQYLNHQLAIVALFSQHHSPFARLDFNLSSSDLLKLIDGFKKHNV